MKSSNKKCILILAIGSKGWIGGIYYKKNFINLLLNNNNVIDKYNIVLLTYEKYKNVFISFRNNIFTEYLHEDANIVEILIKLFFVLVRYRIKYIYSIKQYFVLKLLNIVSVSWIPDFQHCHFPSFFDKNEINKRNANFRQIANDNNPLILSSKDTLRDFQKFYSENRPNVYVVPFTSYIDDLLININEEYEKNVLQKYGLIKNEYILISNQFWQHKNHKIVFEAISKLKRSNKLNIDFVFTGELSDRRNRKYINEIQCIIENINSQRIKVLGNIDRYEQIVLMKNCNFLIQPSLFEGWGTTVEDAKVLNKKVLLSNIPVHVEQKDDNCYLFNPYDVDNLIDCINNIYNKKVIINKKDYCKEYAKNLDNIFA